MTSRRSMLLGLVLGAFLSAAGLNVAYAQVPRSISYQGLLVKNNLPVNGMVNLDIKIYDAASQVLYQETQSQVQVTNGIFNVLLGGNSGVLPASLKFDEQYYLGIDVDKTGELPKTAFVAAPYALNAQTVGGIGVSATPQAGMLLPLDANGKIPKSVLPTGTQALTKINNMDGGLTGNVTIKSGNPATLTVVDDQANNTITLTAIAGGSGIQTVQAGAGLTGGGSTPIVTLKIADGAITSSMLGTSIVRGVNLDQNIPQLGLYQDALGQLNVGINSTLSYVTPLVPTPPGVLHGIGLNLANPNTWTGTQTFSAVPTGLIVTTNAIFNGNVTLNPGVLTINGTPEPLALPNAATYEIVDNGDLKVTGSSYLVGNTYIGAATNGGTNTMGTAGQSANTITGATNVVTGTTSNNIQSPANNIGTTNGGSVNVIGAAGTSSNTVTGATNTVTGTTSNSIQSPANTMGTTQAAGNTNTIGTAGNSTNTITGAANSMTGTTSNNVQSPANNIGTTNASSTNIIGNAGTSNNTMTGLSNNIQGTTNNVGTTTANSANTIGNVGTSTNIITGSANSMTGTASNNIQSPLNNIGTTNASSVTNIGNVNTSTNSMNGLTNNIIATTNNVGIAGASTNTITGVNNTITATTLTTFNGNVLHNGTGEPNAASAGAVTNYELRNLGDFQNSGATNLIGNVFMNQTLTVTGLSTLNGGLTIVGPLTQSGGNANIAGGATNTFGTVGGSNNTIGAAGSNNTITGTNNTFAATTLNNFTGNTQTQNLQVNGTLGSTGNITLGTSSSNNVIGTAGAINTFQGATNNFNATTANNFTGDIIQVSGRVSIAPTAGTTNNFGNAANQINNYGTGSSTTNNIGTGNGSVTNIGTVSGGGISTTNIGNLNAGTNNNINGLTTLSFTGDQTYVRIAGGVASCAGIFPTGAQSELLVNGDGFFDGTLAACRLNIFGIAPSCITNLNTTNFGSCGGPGVPINLISSIIGVPSGAGATDITNMRNIQAQNSIQTNTTLTIGTTGTNATNITSANPGPGAINQQTPSVSGRIPTFQTYTATLIPATGPNGGGSVTITNSAGVPPGSSLFPTLNFDGASAIMVTYRTQNVAVPQGALTVTQSGTTWIRVESSAALDNNDVQITVLRP